MALVCCLAATIVTFFRWYLLVWALDIPFRVQDALRLGFIGYLFNYVAPGAVGGDLIKASMIAREQTSRRLAAVGTVFLDRVIGLMSLLFLGAIMMLWPTPIVEAPKFQYVVGIFQVGKPGFAIGHGIASLAEGFAAAFVRAVGGDPEDRADFRRADLLRADVSIPLAGFGSQRGAWGLSAIRC